MSITLIENPPFSIDLHNLIPTEKKTIVATPSLLERIARSVCIIFKSLAEATYITLKNSGISFKHIVLNYYGTFKDFRFSADIFLIAFKVAFWILGMTWCIATTTSRLYVEKTSIPIELQSQHPLKRYAGSEINPLHIKTNSQALNSKDVPASVKVSDLASIYTSINFTQSALPGYMKDSSRKEHTSTYSIAELKASLDSFINRVHRREAFLGTPPSYDTPRLMAFYQQIEDAVRLSIHKSNQALNEFRAKNGTGVSKYTKDQTNQYKNILEDRARIAIDLAIAGKHCGARYMGDAMSVYDSFYQESEAASSTMTLKDKLIEILAQERKTIAKRQIQQYLGSDTHSYNNYMSSMGKLLAIPDAENIIEHLAAPLNKTDYAVKFFNAYTVDAIITAIQTALKSKNSLRELFIDWVKDQDHNWNKKEYDDKSAQASKAITAILQTTSSSVGAANPFTPMQTLLAHLKEKGVPLPSFDAGWDDFIDELFSLDAARKWRDATLSHLAPHVRLATYQKYKTALREEKIGATAKDQLQKMITETQTIDTAPLTATLSALENTDKINQYFISNALPPLDGAIVQRIIAGTSDLSVVLEGYFNLLRKDTFLRALKLDTLATEGLKPEVMEWLLISQGILLI